MATIDLQDDSLDLTTADTRTQQGIDAGNTYIENLTSIRNELVSEADGASLGAMVGAQLQMTETETQYMVEAGIPKKASSAHQAAAQEVKKAAG